MKPTSLSASALHVADLCLARYKAENIERSRGFGGNAASLGTAVHGGLEDYVKKVYIEKAEQPDLQLLLMFYKLSYISTFESHDTDTVEYFEGYEMLKNWFARTDFDGVRVISCEIKSNFIVPTSIGDLPFNYIWDRFDQIGERDFRVVDYKSSKWGVKPSDLKKKIQARAYGLAAAIQLKRDGIEYDKIWVQFDMLRHDPVGIIFSREEIAATWRFIKDTVEQRIIATPDDKVPETLNSECLFCVRKASCEALKKNIVVGGIHSVGTIEEAIDLRAELEWQRKGLNSLLAELDNKILIEARERDLEEYESDLNVLQIGISKTRAIDAERAGHVLGPKLFEKYGSTNLTMGNVDKLLRGKELDAQQKATLRGLIYDKRGEPRVKVEPKAPIEED